MGLCISDLCPWYQTPTELKAMVSRNSQSRDSSLYNLLEQRLFRKHDVLLMYPKFPRFQQQNGPVWGPFKPLAQPSLYMSWANVRRLSQVTDHRPALTCDLIWVVLSNLPSPGVDGGLEIKRAFLGRYRLFVLQPWYVIHVHSTDHATGSMER